MYLYLHEVAEIERSLRNIELRSLLAKTRQVTDNAGWLIKQLPSKRFSFLLGKDQFIIYCLKGPASDDCEEAQVTSVMSQREAAAFLKGVQLGASL